MTRTDVVILGAGQAGLAMSHCLTASGIDHTLLERGQVAERWRSARWDSLRLLTPRWQARLPGWAYRGPDPDGFMSMPEVIAYLNGYAASFNAPVCERTCVERLEWGAGYYRIHTDRGCWLARCVVIATGDCDIPHIPPLAARLPGHILQLTPDRYRNPAQLPPGGVLVVGASASGAQLADELQRSGRPVTLAVGRHTRLPRRYRGRDIMWWLDQMGIWKDSAAAIPDLPAARRQPSLQLMGSTDMRDLDLETLRARGVVMTGRACGADGKRVYFESDLGRSVAAAHTKLERLLSRIDGYIQAAGLDGSIPAPTPIRPVRAPETRAVLDLRDADIQTVVWATGYRREYGWLKLPVFDARGELRHRDGVTPAPGLYALGLRFLRRRHSNFIDGVGHDAIALTQHLTRHHFVKTRAA